MSNIYLVNITEEILEVIDFGCYISPRVPPSQYGEFSDLTRFENLGKENTIDQCKDLVNNDKALVSLDGSTTISKQASLDELESRRV